MSIIFSTLTRANPATRVYFEAPDDALLARVTEKVASILGRHQAYAFHEPSEVPAGLVPVVLSCAAVCPELALDTGRTQEAPRRAFWRFGEHERKPGMSPVFQADYSSLEQRVLAQSLRSYSVGLVRAAAPQPSPAAQGDALDAERLDWLLLRISGAEFRRIGVHYSGNARRADVDAARKQGENHE